MAVTTLTSSRKVGQSSIVKASCGPLEKTTDPIISRAAVGKRNYGIKTFNQGYNQDNGWDIGWYPDEEGSGPKPWDTDPLLYSRGEMKRGLFFLKAHLDPNIMADRNYFSVNGTLSASIDVNNDGWISNAENDNSVSVFASEDGWSAVPGHKLEIRIAQILLMDGTTITGPDEDYAFLAGNGGQRIDQNSFVALTTDAEGKVAFIIRSGPLIHRCREIRLKAKDTTQVKVATP